ncbi:AMP-dependent synthetase/ligase [Fluviicola sp.]|uniref:AMP-dependent synthetase/ligase n=1 Tax=Fluviicola sp. TaxID=1917219 RepID=UPI0031E22126
MSAITTDMNEVRRLFDVPTYQLKNFPNASMFVTKMDGVWTPMTTEEFVALTNQISKGLVEIGVSIGERVALVSPNRVEWNVMDIAIQQVGAIVVPVYPNISEHDYAYIFNDAGIRHAFVSGADLAHKIQGVSSQIKSLKKIYTFDKLDEFPHYRDLIDLGADVPQNKITELKANVRNEDLATIIYTSGTTGNPKGVMLSHNNLLSNVLSCKYSIPADEHSRVLTFLPVCHVYERMLHYLYMYCGSAIYFAESMDTIGPNLVEVKPHVFTAVPRLLEKVFDRIMLKGEELTGFKRRIFFWSVSVAEKYDTGKLGFWYKIKLGIARKLVFSKWQEALGGEVKAIASGSAALQPRLAQIFLAAGVNVLEGYGLTETSPVISVNCLKKGIKIGTVGPLIDGVKVKIAEDGEILVKGPNVMMGYYNLPDKTAEAIDAQGWFHTGDIGMFVDDIFLKITDRKKEIFKTSGGKYIIPQAMENTFKESRFIEQIMVLGEGQKFPAALIVPAFPFVKEWASRKGIKIGDSPEEIAKNADVIARIQQEVDRINTGYGNWEKIKKFALLAKEFGIESGELTPTLKLKRKIILEKYKTVVDGFYEEHHHE